MRSSCVVEVQVAADRDAGLADTVVGVQIHLLVFDTAPQPLDEHISRQAPLLSMLIVIALSASTPVKAAPVNCEPSSVLRMSGLPWRAKASSSVSTQNIDTRHDSTRRLNQSST